MKAVQLVKTGGPENLHYGDVPAPEIESESAVLVRVKAAGINPVDIKQRGRGTWYPSELPAILGIDGSGIIEKTGSKVTRFNEGDEVYFAHGGVGKEQGNYAEYTVMEERFLAPKPKSLSFAEAAGAPSSLITAADSLFQHGQLRKGETVLIQAGAGGVGHLTVQMAVVHGARVATTVNTNEKAELVRSLGAEKIIFYEKKDFVEETLEWTNNRGVDLAVDIVGKKTFFDTFRAVRYYGRVVTLLGPDPDHADWMEARLRNLAVSFELMPSPMFYDLIDQQERQTQVLRDCTQLFEQGKLRVVASRTYALREAPDAHRYIEKGETMGKVVLLMDEES